MSSSSIHPSAIIDPGARLGSGVSVAPYAIIGPAVSVGAGCSIGPHATLERNVRLAEGVRVGQGSIIGGDPQDLKYRGEETWVEIGAGSVIREYCTVNRGTAQAGVTRIGAGVYLMSYVHVAHDCRIADGAILSNCVQLAGHVTIQERANLSGLVAVHQFVNIGSYAFVGGLSRVTQDIPPYVMAVGNPVELFGLNTVGLQRAGFPGATIATLKRLYRFFFNSELSVAQAMDRARLDLPALPEVEHFLEFLAASERGVPA
jgi:UDP-N-acetylglucosamine acyltransferase